MSLILCNNFFWSAKMAWLARWSTCMYSPKVSLSSNLNFPLSRTSLTQERVRSEMSSSLMWRIVSVAACNAPSRSFSAPASRLSSAVRSSPSAPLYCTRRRIAISTGLFTTLMAFLHWPSCVCAAMAAWYSGPKSSSIAACWASGNDFQSGAAAPPMDSGTRWPPVGTGVVTPSWNFDELRSNWSAKSAPLSARSRQNCMMSVPGGNVMPGGRTPGGNSFGAIVVLRLCWEPAGCKGLELA
mmetsp:Transcript_109224/g.308065  ORF Transcript_109224/g.308065 Transcript_109224/m.308065 type:complete len:241 (+) Transcript_109224:275-997(+)